MYVDASVVLAHVLAEDVRPDESFWTADDLLSSRLTEYECWVRLNAYGRADADGARLAATLRCLGLLSLEERVCARCRAPFPVPVRTLDAIHLSTADHLRSQGIVPRIATYDRRMYDAARAMGFAVFPSELPQGA